MKYLPFLKRLHVETQVCLVLLLLMGMILKHTGLGAMATVESIIRQVDTCLPAKSLQEVTVN